MVQLVTDEGLMNCDVVNYYVGLNFDRSNESQRVKIPF